MILRRVIAHFRKQEWTAIALDFLIVVVGVFVGLQVNNWNAARADERTYEDAMLRLAEESRAMIDYAKESRTLINTRLSDVQPAIKTLRECRAGPHAEEIVNQGLNTIRSGHAPGVVTLTIDQLVSDERLLDRQSDAERAALRQYHADLHGIDGTAGFLQSAVIAVKDDNNPVIDFTDILDPHESLNKVDVRRAHINIPVAQACKDLSFIKLFYNWERVHVFQLKLIDEIESTVTENARALDLAGFSNETNRSTP